MGVICRKCSNVERLEYFCIMSYAYPIPSFSRDQVEKIGNAIIYTGGRIKDLNKTKILKLLFLLEESSVKKYGYPFFGIDFQLWKHGPVSKDIFIDLSNDNLEILQGFIKKQGAVFVPVAEFNDDEFSDNDIRLMDDVIEYAKDKNASELVDILHSSNSLWSLTAKRHGILEDLLNEKINSTEINVDFSILFEGNEERVQFLNEMKESRDFAKKFGA